MLISLSRIFLLALCKRGARQIDRLIAQGAPLCYSPSEGPPRRVVLSPVSLSELHMCESDPWTRVNLLILGIGPIYSSERGSTFLLTLADSGAADRARSFGVLFFIVCDYYFNICEQRVKVPLQCAR